ncbi:methionyl-tRNA formyltransferase [Dehalococcoides mccartyi]|uniref:methionyl-tRNA formyltransferase n=1 Tax=Dehalococcoides mccartyi TaxID=61435 RepID=UPI0006BC3EC5|nr:methionyl-tRNA formyltransferase [Dehalococcoides mccartyi]BAS32594.1 methionyl-tRNA formyltransferase [Dehalococcoides mccartyi IBARAKI]
MAVMNKLKMVFMGSPSFALTPLKMLLAEGYDICGVYTQPDRPAGRGRELCPPPVKTLALEHGLAVYQPQSLKKPEEQAFLKELKPDVIVVAAYGLILPQEVLDIPVYGVLNIHPSLLPRYRGATPVAATLLGGDEWAGVSLMKLEAGLDTGPVYSRSMVAIRPEDTTPILADKLAFIGGCMLLELLSQIPSLPEPKVQDNTQASYFGMVTKEMGLINWQTSAVEIERRVRAFFPWPGVFTTFNQKTLKILEAKPRNLGLGLKPSEVRVYEQSRVMVGSASGELEIIRLQLEGKAGCSAADFVRGQRNFDGVNLGV